MQILPFWVLYQIQKQFIRKKKIQIVDLSTNKNIKFSLSPHLVPGLTKLAKCLANTSPSVHPPFDYYCDIFSFHHYRYRRQPRLHSGRHGLHTGSGLQSLSSKGYNRFLALLVLNI